MKITYSVAETAEIFGVSERLVYDLVDRRDLPSVEFGKRILIPARAIELLVDRAMKGFDPDKLVTRIFDEDEDEDE